MTLYLSIVLALFLIHLTAATIYLVGLALASLLIKEKPPTEADRNRKFAILIPAHNEELLIARLLESLLAIDYPTDRRNVFVVADNCLDNTAEIASRYPVSVLKRIGSSKLGKGFAIQYALKNIQMEYFDAVLIIDADSVVDRDILLELNLSLSKGEKAIQCQNGVANRHDSWFTELLYVSRLINNRLYHAGKYKLCLSSYLMGNGICLSTELLSSSGWNAFSLGEDWEYYALLANEHIRIGFNLNAKVFHQESRSLDQATSQRLRWSKGRFSVARKLGLKLLARGVCRRDWLMIDSSLPLIFPNYSLQVNLTILSVLLSLVLRSSTGSGFLAVSLGLLFCQFSLFLIGMLLAGQFYCSLIALLRTPVFLIWKSAIDLLSITGLYRGNKWVRTRRHSPA